MSSVNYQLIVFRSCVISSSRLLNRIHNIRRQGQVKMTIDMIKMDMIWVAISSLLYPETRAAKTVSLEEIRAQVKELFNISINPIMVERHLISSEGRQADKKRLRRGGSRKRYLFRTIDGFMPSREGGFRLYKRCDATYDGWEKTGPIHPESSAVARKYQYLIEWYQFNYFISV